MDGAVEISDIFCIVQDYMPEYSHAFRQLQSSNDFLLVNLFFGGSFDLLNCFVVFLIILLIVVHPTNQFTSFERSTSTSNSLVVVAPCSVSITLATGLNNRQIFFQTLGNPVTKK